MVILSNCPLNIHFHHRRFVLLLTLVEKLLTAMDSDEYRDGFLFKVPRRVTDFFICINLSPKGQGTLQKKEQEERESWRTGRMLWHAVLRMCHGCCAHSSHGCLHKTWTRSSLSKSPVWNRWEALKTSRQLRSYQQLTVTEGRRATFLWVGWKLVGCPYRSGWPDIHEHRVSAGWNRYVNKWKKEEGMRLGRKRVGDTGRRVMAFVSPIPIIPVTGFLWK